MSRWDRDDLEEVREDIRKRADKILARSDPDYGRAFWSIARRVLLRAAADRRCWRSDFLDYQGDFHQAFAEATLARIKRADPAWYGETLDDSAAECAAKLAGDAEKGGDR